MQNKKNPWLRFQYHDIFFEFLNMTLSENSGSANFYKLQSQYVFSALLDADK